MFLQTLSSKVEDWSTASLALSTVALLYVTSRTFNAVYNVFFHPLRKFPGPWYRAAFAWPDLISLFNGDTLFDTKTLHDRYGPIVRLAPDALSYTSAEAWKDIYGFGPGKAQIPKDYKRFPVPADKNIIKSSDSDHARMRNHLGHAFSDQALRGQEPLLVNSFDTLIKRLRDQITGPEKGVVDMMSWYNFMTFDIISEMCLGDPFGAMKDGSYAPYIRNLFAGFKFFRFLYVAQEYPWTKVLLSILLKLPAMKKQQGIHFMYTESRTRKRIEQGQTDRKDFINYILQYDDKKGMTTPEIVETSAILMTAGAETAAGSLASATFQLLKHPDAYKRVTAEVRAAFTSDNDMRIKTVGQLPYLNAVVEEVLRIIPPAAGVFARRTDARGATVCGEFIPPNISLGVHQWSANHSASNFTDPDDFVPERWLADKPAKYKNDNVAAMQAFSYGPRNCVGRSLAYYEVRSVLCRMLFNFDMELQPESEEWATGQKFHILWEKPPLMVKLIERKSV